jgi:hypothetical protein
MLVAMEARSYLTQKIESISASDITKNMYKSAFNIQIERYGTSQTAAVISINFTTEDWVVAALEDGAAPFSIKEKMLDDKSTISSEGYRYRRIPITNRLEKSSSENKPPSTEMEIDRLNTIIKSLKPKISRILKQPSGLDFKVVEDEFYAPGKETPILKRVRTFSSKRTRIPRQTIYTTFKTMSDKPGTSTWEHPGMVANYLVEHLEDWCKSRIDTVADRIVEQAMRSIFYGG